MKRMSAVFGKNEENENLRKESLVSHRNKNNSKKIRNSCGTNKRKRGFNKGYNDI